MRPVCHVPVTMKHLVWDCKCHETEVPLEWQQLIQRKEDAMNGPEDSLTAPTTCRWLDQSLVRLRAYLRMGGTSTRSCNQEDQHREAVRRASLSAMRVARRAVGSAAHTAPPAASASRTLKTFVRAATNNSNEVLQSALRVVRVVQMEKWQLERLSLGTPAQRENLVPSSPSQKLQPNDPASSSTARSAASCCSGSSSGDAVAGLSVSRRRLRALSVCTRVEPGSVISGRSARPIFPCCLSLQMGDLRSWRRRNIGAMGPMGYTSLRRLFGQKMGGKKKVANPQPHTKPDTPAATRPPCQQVHHARRAAGCCRVPVSPQ